MIVECLFCKSEFEKKDTEVRRYPKNLCSRKCSAALKHSLKQKELHPCFLCNKSTTNPKFCSCSCAAKWSNKNVVRRKRIAKPRYVQTREERTESFKKKTLNQVTIEHERSTYRFNAVRAFNKSWNGHLSKLPCAVCGYEKHVQLAHKKAVKDFSEEALLEEINSPENVIQLCPNCHWEFDNGLLRL